MMTGYKLKVNKLVKPKTEARNLFLIHAVISIAIFR
jgi:hypothetical protein